VRALVVSNMLPDAGHPERGRFVRDQVDALRKLGGVEVELYEFPPGGAALVDGARELRRHHRGGGHRLDVVHAHFGLTAWPAFAVRAGVRGLTVHGTDVRHPRTRLVTRAALPLIDLIAAPTPELARELPGRRARRRAQVLPCGVDTERFHPIPRATARAELGLAPHTPCLLFPADPARPGKRYDRALALARALAPAGGQTPHDAPSPGARPTPHDALSPGARPTLHQIPSPGARSTANAVPLHTLGGVAPEQVPLWVNAANAVVVPSEAEGFGLAALEALACDVPVLATPVGVHRQALEGVAGALCAPFDVGRWRAAAAPHLADPDPRVAGRAHAELLSATRMAERLVEAWRSCLAEGRRDMECDE
jgi:teichuronic acid biosynthesis glycosyltransferase TuaC